MVAVDPLASLASRDIWVTLDGHEYRLPAKPAIDWLEVILTGDSYGILPGWLDVEDQQKIFDAMWADRINDVELEQATQDALTAAAGRPWWWAAQLVLVCAATNKSWSTLHGRVVLAGVDPGVVPLGAYIDALYAACLEGFGSNQEARQKFDVHMDTPPPSVGLDEESEGEAFMALLNGG